MSPAKKYGAKNSHKFRTIHLCLVALGADAKNVYKRLDRPYRPVSKMRRYDSSIWQSWGVYEIDKEVERLYKEAVKNFHPDLNGGDEWYVDKMVTINMARDRAKHLLQNHR